MPYSAHARRLRLLLQVRQQASRAMQSQLKTAKSWAAQSCFALYLLHVWLAGHMCLAVHPPHGSQMEATSARHI